MRKIRLVAIREYLDNVRTKAFWIGILALPPSGVTVETAELPDLPATKALVLQDAKRSIRILPYQHWIEKNIKTGTIVVDKKAIKITVKK